MKIYCVDKGTKAVLLERMKDGSITTTNWTTRKDLTFSDHELVVDPVILSNNPDMTQTTETQLAAIGFSVFSTAANIRYSLAVDANDVKVVC
jgi:hypothetical protein